MHFSQAGRRKDSMHGTFLVAVVCLATALEVLISQSLLGPMSHLFQGGSQAAALCSTVMIFEIATVQLIFVCLSDLFSPPLRLIRTLSLCNFLGPWIAASITIPLVFSLADADTATHQAPSCAFLVAAVVGFVGVIQIQALLMFGLPTEQPETTPWASTNLRPTLGQNLRHIQLTSASSIVLITLAFVWAERGNPLDLIEYSYLNFGVLTLGTFVVLAGVCNLRLLSNPDQQLLHLAERLDGIVHSDNQTLVKRIPVTRLDSAGQLIHHVDQVRKKLATQRSDREAALDHCRQTQATKRDFFSALSQELGTRLQSISDLSRLLLEEQQQPINDAQREDIRLIQAAGSQLNAIIQDILDISLIESGELSLNFREENPQEIIEEAIAILNPLLRKKNLTIETKFASELPMIVCDRARIGQVLNNLVHNAIKFTEEGTITVQTQCSENRSNIKVYVKDTGIGIAPADLDSIFEEYRQLNAKRGDNKGTGLGLAIARSIASYHGGTLTVESEPDRGSTFQLELPTRPPHQPKVMTEHLAPETMTEKPAKPSPSMDDTQ